MPSKPWAIPADVQFCPLHVEQSEKIVQDNFWTNLGNVNFLVNRLATLQLDRYWTNFGYQNWTFIGQKWAMAYGPPITH